MTFKDKYEKGEPFTLYVVSRGGSVRRYDKARILKRKYRCNVFRTDSWEVVEYALVDCGCSFSLSNLNTNRIGLKNGNVDPSWGSAAFLDVDDACNLAERIAETKYSNSIKAISKIRKGG